MEVTVRSYEVAARWLGLNVNPQREPPLAGQSIVKMYTAKHHTLTQAHTSNFKYRRYRHTHQTSSTDDTDTHIKPQV